jgi:superfamily II DNA or RNA helicase
MLLRPRQKELVQKSVAALEEHGNTLAVAPTGAGKTIMLSAIIGEIYRKKPVTACVLAHRDELTEQNESKFQRVNPGISTAVFNATIKSWAGNVTFAMVQTLCRERNLDAMPPLDMLVIDEAHHARADSYVPVIERAKELNPHLRLLGMTATPNRGDKKGLRPIFSNVADQITVKELIASGHLVPPRTFVMDVGVNDQLGKVRKTALDFDMNEVAAIMNTSPINEAVVAHWKEKAGDRKTVVFCSTVQHAFDVASSFNAAGVNAVCVHGGMSEHERADTIGLFTHGHAQVIVNVAVLTEGWDYPPTSCVILLRPSSFKSTMIQMVGRGLRTVDPIEHPDIVKRDCIVLDFGTSSLIHGSLEQEASLEDQVMEGDAPIKECPECEASVPIAVRECPLCGYVWESATGSKPAASADFVMTEIDLLGRSNFLWCGLDNHDRQFVAAGFNAWAGVFLKDGDWHAVGAKNKEKPRLLASGERLVCFATADDWLNLYENESTAHKTRSWLHQPATERQLQYLPPAYRHDYSLTRYKASAMMTLQFNRQAIMSAINNGRVAA